jgi:predicted CopG family antitoxin
MDIREIVNLKAEEKNDFHDFLREMYEKWKRKDFNSVIKS